jgi:phospholipid-binding lipoprotein MlaA
VSNFFNNLSSITTVVNDLLQFKLSTAFTDAGRFVINTTFGLAGVIDVAGMDNIPNHKEDFGQTLGYWGVGNGAYLVLPIFGASTVRDTVGYTFDTFTRDPISYIHSSGDIAGHNRVRIGQIIDRRSQLLDAKEIVDNASLDAYAFTRDAYFQRRNSLISDGAKSNIDDGFEPADEDKPSSSAPATEPTKPATDK